jgi:hypothetical protein
MRPVHLLIASLLLLAWLPASAHCRLAGAFPEAFSECGAAHGGEPCDEIPSEDGCAPCQTIGTGVNPSSLLAFALNAPAWHEMEALAEWVRFALRAAESGPVEWAAPVSPPLRPIWIFVVRAALPVRAPSLPA